MRLFLLVYKTAHYLDIAFWANPIAESFCVLMYALFSLSRMKIKVLPNVLALHLKRFKLLPAEDKYVKLSYRVAFPLELRLFNTVDDAEDPDRLYRLFAIVVHIGG